MNENNIPNIDGEENTIPETTDTPVEDAAEEVFEEVQEVYETEEDVADDALDGEADAEDAEPAFETEESFVAEATQKKSGAGKVVAIVIVIIAVLAAIGFGVFKYITRNPYNEMGYINVSGRTVKDVAEQAGFESVEAFLAEYGLPADMPEDTEEAAAYYNIPTKKIAEMYGMETASLKEMLGLGDDVTEDTPWGEAEGKATLGKYIGEENLDSFKEHYGLGEDVTADTLWGEVRNIVDQKSLEDQKAAEDAAAQQGDDAAAVGDDVPVADDAEAAPEGEAAE